MKYLFNTLFLLLFITLLASCENEHTDELMIEKRQLEDYRITFLEYAMLPDQSLPYQNKYFDEVNPAKDYLPDWLLTKFFQIEDQSSVVVSYNYKQERGTDLDAFNGTFRVLTGDEYMKSWGGVPYVYAFTPTVPPQTNIPILIEDYLVASQDAMQLVEYNHSLEDAFIKTNSHILYLDENFDTSNGRLSNIGWDNRTGNMTRRWMLRTFNDDSRAMATANGVNNTTQLDSWLISGVVDLTQSINPKMSFDLGLGYFSDDLFFSVHLIEAENYDSDDIIRPNAWTDISELFNLPTSGPSGYGSLLNRGEVSLNKYAGKKIRVGFRYTGKINPEYNISTSYELDNVRIDEVADQLVVSSAYAKHDLFRFDNGEWNMLNDDDLYVLQPDDYVFLNVEFIDPNKAFLLIPKVLSKNSISANGNLKVVYKNSPHSFCADEFSYIESTWNQISPLSTIRKEDKYIFSESENKWEYTETMN